jgi:hypothetical protein
VKHTSHKSHLSHASHVTQRGSAENIKALLSGNAGNATPGNADLPIGSVTKRANRAFRLSYPKWQKVYNVGFRVICPAK